MTLRLRQNLPADAHIVGVDNSAAMVSRCRHNMARDHSQASYEICQQNLQDTVIENASMVILNFTLQFIADIERPSILKNIADGMRPGGVYYWLKRSALMTHNNRTYKWTYTTTLSVTKAIVILKSLRSGLP